MDDGEVVIIDGGVEVAVWRLDGPVDLGLVDDLARLQLAAAAARLPDRLRRPSPELCRAARPGRAGRGDRRAAGLVRSRWVGQAEGGEQLGVEEVVEPGDPPA